MEKRSKIICYTLGSHKNVFQASLSEDDNLRDRIEIDEITKWIKRIRQVLPTVVIRDPRASHLLENIRAYTEDCNYFLKEKKDLVLAFEAIIWAWAWLEIGKHLGMLDFRDYHDIEEGK